MFESAEDLMTKMFNGKVALITGAAQGIGAATARMFVANGANVVLGDLLESVVDLAGELGDDRAAALCGDVSSAAYGESLVKLAMTRFGRLDFAFNNAGVGGNQVPIDDLEIENWQRVIDIDLNGVFYGMRYQIPVIRDCGGGVIINTSSVLGLKPLIGSSLEYTAAKHGVIGLTKQAAVNHGADGIRCNAICPGFIETAVVADQPVDFFVERTSMGRTGTPEEIAGMVKALCSENGSFVNGACIPVDGGFVLY
jgi:NAD(P)-dependent dehydrogenase (short-subunit alcohol dehydrogenase family)